jgi:hypothetical protein
MAVHTNVNMPNRSIPNPPNNAGTVSKPKTNGPPVPKTDQKNDSDNDGILPFTPSDLFQNLTD